MAKISLLDPIDAPTGDETVVVLINGVTKRARLRDLTDAAVDVERQRAIAAENDTLEYTDARDQILAGYITEDRRDRIARDEAEEKGRVEADTLLNEIKADKAVTIAGGGLVTGALTLANGGTLTVTPANDADAENGALDNRALTPANWGVQRDTWQFQTYDTPIVIDVQGGFVYYGKFVLSREGSAPRVIDPAAYGLPSFKVSLGTSATAVHHYVDVARIDTVVAGVANIPIQQKTGGGVAAQRQRVFPLANSAFGKYHCYWSNNIIRSDELPATRLSISGPAAELDDDNRYGGGVNAIYFPLGSVFDPVENFSYGNVANPASAELPTHCKIVMGDGSTAQAVVFDTTTLTYSVVEYPNLPALLIAKPGKIKLVVNRWGQTFQSVFDLIRTSAATRSMSVAGAKPLIGRELFLVSDRLLPVYLDNMLLTRGRGCPRVSITSFKSVTAQPLAIEQAGGCVMIDPALTGSAVRLTVSPDQAGNRHVANMVASVKAVPVTGSPAPKILGFGDSITFFQTLSFADALLRIWGFNPQWLGTIESAATVAANDTAGPKAEARPNWSLYEEFLGHNLGLGNTPGGVLPVGQETAYRNMTRDQRRGINPYLNPNINAGAQTDIVTIGGVQYRADLRFFLDRFGIATPDIIPLNYGMNDLLHNNASPTSISNFSAALPQVLNEFRRAASAAQIMLWSTAVPNTPTPNSWTAGAWGAIRRKIVEEVEARRVSDPKIHLCSVWVHQSADAGWDLVGGAAGADGIISSIVGEIVHPQDIARLQHAQAMAAGLANLSPV